MCLNSHIWFNRYRSVSTGSACMCWIKVYVMVYAPEAEGLQVARAFFSSWRVNSKLYADFDFLLSRTGYFIDVFCCLKVFVYCAERDTCSMCSTSVLAWSSSTSPVVLTRSRLCMCCPLSLGIRLHTLWVSVFRFMHVRKAGQLFLFALGRTRLPNAFAL